MSHYETHDERIAELVRYRREWGEWPALGWTESIEEHAARNAAARIVNKPEHIESKLTVARLTKKGLL